MKSADFGNHPDLLGSRGDDSKRRHQVGHGRWQAQDRFLLITDALTQYSLLHTEECKDPLTEISPLPPENIGFPDWRMDSVLRNDDVTLMVVDLD
jgi:hypothetical protein